MARHRVARSRRICLPAHSRRRRILALEIQRGSGSRSSRRGISSLATSGARPLFQIGPWSAARPFAAVRPFDQRVGIRGRRLSQAGGTLAILIVLALGEVSTATAATLRGSRFVDHGGWHGDGPRDRPPVGEEAQWHRCEGCAEDIDVPGDFGARLPTRPSSSAAVLLGRAPYWRWPQTPTPRDVKMSTATRHQ
jgi:hypothetical protein